MTQPPQFLKFPQKNRKEQRATHGINNFSIPCHLCSSDVERFCKLQCVFYKLDPNLGFGTLALELTMHCAGSALLHKNPHFKLQMPN